jgi:hypothetical protein
VSDSRGTVTLAASASTMDTTKGTRHGTDRSKSTAACLARHGLAGDDRASGAEAPEGARLMTGTVTIDGVEITRTRHGNQTTTRFTAIGGRPLPMGRLTELRREAERMLAVARAKAEGPLDWPDTTAEVNRHRPIATLDYDPDYARRLWGAPPPGGHRFKSGVGW